MLSAPPGSVAGRAIVQLNNLAAGVDLFHPRGLVLVAVVARVGHEVLGGELLLGGVVTGNARRFPPTCAVIDRKDVRVSGAAPGVGRMAMHAIGCRPPGVEFETALVDIGLRVAGGAIVGRILVAGGLMARAAFHQSMLAGQLKVRAIMIEGGHVRQERMRTLVFGMAGAARHALSEPAVQGSLRVKLVSNVGMASEAARRHARATPGRGMAGGAIAAEFRVGSHPAQANVALGPLAQGTGAEHAAAGRRHERQERDQRERGDDLGGCQPAQIGHDEPPSI